MLYVPFDGILPKRSKTPIPTQVLQQQLLRQPFSCMMWPTHAAPLQRHAYFFFFFFFFFFLQGNALPALPFQAEAPPLGQQPLGQQVHSPFRPPWVRTGHPSHVNPSPDALRITTNVLSSNKTLPTPVKVLCLSMWLQGHSQKGQH